MLGVNSTGWLYIPFMAIPVAYPHLNDSFLDDNALYQKA